MLKFIHKKHIHKNVGTKAFVIYYSVSDIVLGFLLIVLVGFFIYNYLQFSFQIPNYSAVSSTISAPARIPTTKAARIKAAR